MSNSLNLLATEEKWISSVEKLITGQKAVVRIKLRSFEELSLKVELINEK